MTDFPSRKSGAAFAPPHPDAFRLVGHSLPLAGLNDTYWLARAVWIDGDNGDVGFLIYADNTHYLFLDDAEASAASMLIGALQPQAPGAQARRRRSHLAVTCMLLAGLFSATLRQMIEHLQIRPGRQEQLQPAEQSEPPQAGTSQPFLLLNGMENAAPSATLAFQRQENITGDLPGSCLGGAEDSVFRGRNHRLLSAASFAGEEADRRKSAEALASD